MEEREKLLSKWSQEDLSKARDELFRTATAQRELHFKGQMEFVKWTTAMATGTLVLGRDILTELSSFFPLQLIVLFGATLLFLSIICAAMFMHNWLDFCAQALRMSEIILDMPPVLPKSFWPQEPITEESARPILKAYQEFKEIADKKYKWAFSKARVYYNMHLSTFVMGLLLFVGPYSWASMMPLLHKLP